MTRRHIRKAFWVLVWVAGLGTTGCASYGTRVGGTDTGHYCPGLYPGVRHDVDYVTQREESDEPHFWWLGYLDLPLSAAFDTLLLPFDLLELSLTGEHVTDPESR